MSTGPYDLGGLEMTTNDPAPIVSNRMKAVTGVLLVLLAAASCARTPTKQDLTGMWATVPVVTARGTTSEEFCFAADGSIEWTTRTPGATSRLRGNYTLVGDVLTIQTPDLDTPPTLKASLSLGKLELTSPKGSKQKYSKIAGTCEDKGK
jgi:hypothetical protein